MDPARGTTALPGGNQGWEQGARPEPGLMALTVPSPAAWEAVTVVNAKSHVGEEEGREGTALWRGALPRHRCWLKKHFVTDTRTALGARTTCIPLWVSSPAVIGKGTRAKYTAVTGQSKGPFFLKGIRFNPSLTLLGFPLCSQPLRSVRVPPDLAWKELKSTKILILCV